MFYTDFLLIFSFFFSILFSKKKSKKKKPPPIRLEAAVSFWFGLVWYLGYIHLKGTS